jgi:hypothetical protein
LPRLIHAIEPIEQLREMLARYLGPWIRDDDADVTVRRSARLRLFAGRRCRIALDKIAERAAASTGRHDIRSPCKSATHRPPFVVVEECPHFPGQIHVRRIRDRLSVVHLCEKSMSPTICAMRFGLFDVQ